MTDGEKQQEGLDTSSVIISPQEQNDPTDLALVPTFQPDLAIVKYNPEQKVLDFGQGTAAWCLDSIVMNKDLMSARERIRKQQKVGKTLKEKIVESKKITAGYLFKAGSCRIGKTIFDIQKENMAKKRQNDKDKANKAGAAHIKMMQDYEAALALKLDPKNDHQTSQCATKTSQEKGRENPYKEIRVTSSICEMATTRSPSTAKIRLS